MTALRSTSIESVMLYHRVGVTQRISWSGEPTSHQKLSKEVNLLEPEPFEAIAVDKEVERLAVGVPPFVRVVTATYAADEYKPVPVEKNAKEQDNSDGVDEDERHRCH